MNYMLLIKGRTLIFSIFGYIFWQKNPKSSKMARNTFWLMKKPQDQIFRPKMWPKGWILNLVTLLWWNPEYFEKPQKSTFFYQNGFKIGQNVVLCLKFWIRPLKTNYFRLYTTLCGNLWENLTMFFDIYLDTEKSR